MAKGVEKYDVKVCDFKVLSNHKHMLLIPGSADQLRRFMSFVNGNIGKEGGRLHGWKEKVLAKTVSIDPDNQLSP